MLRLILFESFDPSEAAFGSWRINYHKFISKMVLGQDRGFINSTATNSTKVPLLECLQIMVWEGAEWPKNWPGFNRVENL